MTGEPLRVSVPASPAQSYVVHLGAGLLSSLGELVAEALPAHRYAIVSDDRVASLLGGAVLATLSAAGLRADLFSFPAGERQKTRGTWADVTDRMLAAGLGRDSAVIALGGGVSGDLGGFVASTYMRGIPFAGVPTTLLAMLDSAVGGKTGVDTPAAKNAVGAFHDPRVVVVDPEVLASLPAVELRAGLAEAVKAAAIRDARLFEWIEANSRTFRAGDTVALEELIRACVGIKAEVVGADPTETGLREILNFGHTVGHALESATGYAHLHGQAVAAGMRVEARLGEAIGVTEPGTALRLDRVLEACGIPDLLTRPSVPGGLSASALVEAAGADKKARCGDVRCVLLRSIGEVAREPSGSWAHRLPPGEAVEHVAAALRTAVNVRDSAS